MKKLILATILAGMLVVACGHKTTVPTTTENTTPAVTTVPSTATENTTLTADQEAFVQYMLTKCTWMTRADLVAAATQYNCWTVKDALKIWPDLAKVLD